MATMLPQQRRTEALMPMQPQLHLLMARMLLQLRTETMTLELLARQERVRGQALTIHRT